MHGGVLGLGGPGGREKGTRTPSDRDATASAVRSEASGTPVQVRQAISRGSQGRSVRRGVEGRGEEGVKPLPTDLALEGWIAGRFREETAPSP